MTWLLPAHAPLGTLVAVALAGALAFAWCCRPPPGIVALGVATLAVAALGTARGAAGVHVAGPGTADYYIGRHVTLVGSVVRSSGSASFQALWLGDLHQRSGAQLGGTIQLSARAPGPIPPGTVIRVTGTLERLPPRALDGSTGFDDRMERMGVLAAMPGANITQLAPGRRPGLPLIAWRTRQVLSSGVRARVPEPEATILLGELAGIRGKLPGNTEAQLVDSGLVHLLALSGLKVAMVGGLFAGVLRNAGRRAALLAIVFIFAFAAVGGGSAAALRAATVASLTLVARVLRRDPDPVRNLLLAAAAMLGLDPNLAADLSFQYTFLGVGGIQLAHAWLGGRPAFLPRAVREPLLVSCGAQLATLPLTAMTFHVIPFCGPLANLVAIPMLGPTMAAAAWSALAMPDPGGVVAMAAAGSAHVLLSLAGVAAAIPAGVLRVPWFSLPHAMAYYGAVLVAIVATAAGARVRFVVSIAVGAAAALLALTARPDGRMDLVFLDSPGGGVLVSAPDGARMLVDTGTAPAPLGAGLDARLPPGSAPLRILMLTSSRPVATAGVAGLGAREVEALAVPGVSSGTAAQGIATAFAERGLPVDRLVPGDSLTWHGVEIGVTDCGPGIGVVLSFGQSRAWICDAGQGTDRGVPPPGRLEVADLGDGTAEPSLPLQGRPWVVIHGTHAGRGSLSAALLGPRLWRTGKDGPLELDCDSLACRRPGGP